MINPIRFAPPRKKGIFLHVLVLLLLVSASTALLFFAASQPPGIASILLLVGALVASLPAPFFFYRLYGLLKSGYWVAREGLRLRWGLRQVDLPHEAIVDIARVEELEKPIATPPWVWAGAVVGEVRDAEIGVVEFMASDRQGLVFLGTKERTYAISPEDPKEFVAVRKRESERGGLRSIRFSSISPSFVLFEAWAEPRVRRLLTLGAVLSLGLLFLVGLLAPTLETVSLGFGADGLPLPPVAGVQLFLFPALNLFFFVGSLFFGLLFYQEKRGADFSNLLWVGSLLTSFLFLLAVFLSL